MRARVDLCVRMGILAAQGSGSGLASAQRFEFGEKLLSCRSHPCKVHRMLALCAWSVARARARDRERENRGPLASQPGLSLLPGLLRRLSVLLQHACLLTCPPAPRPQVRDRVSQVQKQLKRHEHALRDKIAKDAADLEQSLCELEH